MTASSARWRRSCAWRGRTSPAAWRPLPCRVKSSGPSRPPLPSARRRHRRRRARHRPGDAIRPAPASWYRTASPVNSSGVAPAGDYTDRPDQSPRVRTENGDAARADHGAEVARPRGSSLPQEVHPLRSAAVRPARDRHHVPHRQGRHGRRPRPLRLGQDRRAAPAGQVVGCRHRRSTSAAASAATR